MRERKRRSLLKATSWRVTSTIITFFTSWLITGNLEAALSIGGIEFFSKFLLYYFHERAWGKIKIGLREPEYNI